MLCLVNDLIDLYLIKNGTFSAKITPANLNVSIKDIYNILSLQASEKDVKISIKLHENVVNETLMYDDQRIRSIIQTLVMNAIKFSRPGGEINIEAKLTGARSDKIFLSVADKGIGMTEDIKDTVFTMFRSITKRPNQVR